MLCWTRNRSKFSILVSRKDEAKVPPIFCAFDLVCICNPINLVTLIQRNQLHITSRSCLFALFGGCSDYNWQLVLCFSRTFIRISTHHIHRYPSFYWAFKASSVLQWVTALHWFLLIDMFSKTCNYLWCVPTD